MARDAVAGDAPDALFISCTNLPTYDVIPQLEAELRMPVLSANQVTLWDALRRIGKEAVGPYQALVDPVARRGPAAMNSSATLPVSRAEEPSEPAESAEQGEQSVRPVEPEAALASAGAESGEPLEGYDPGFPAGGTDEWGGGSQPPV